MAQSDDDFGPRRYRVQHRTTYTYDADVEACYERGLLAPRHTATQTVLAQHLVIDPEPALVVEHVDFFGNTSHYVEIRTPHRRLEVTKTFDVDVARPRPDPDAINRWTVAQAASMLADPRAHGLDPLWTGIFRLPSALVSDADDVADYARSHIDPAMPLGDALQAMTMGIHRDFTFRRGVTSVRSTLSEVLALRVGVCQDFSHLAIGCLRSLGLPTRYVSGYIETIPPPGRPKLAGSDASHAWASVLLPDGTWVAIDPTNRQFVDSRYVVTAFGRDFGDVSPLKGIVHTDSERSTLDVGVDVIRLA